MNLKKDIRLSVSSKTRRYLVSGEHGTAAFDVMFTDEWKPMSGGIVVFHGTKPIRDNDIGRECPYVPGFRCYEWASSALLAEEYSGTYRNLDVGVNGDGSADDFVWHSLERFYREVVADAQAVSPIAFDVEVSDGE